MGAEERVLEDRNCAPFVQLLTALRDARHPYGPRADRLFRMHPERWLESLMVGDVSVIDERLESESALFAGAGIFGCGPGDDRCVDDDARRAAGSGGVEGG